MTLSLFFALLSTAIGEPATVKVDPAKPAVEKTSVAAKSAVKKKAVEPTVITSESAEFDQKSQKALLSGNVHIIHDGMELWGDRVDVTLDATNKIKDLIATGNIVIKRDEGTVTCGRAEYDEAKGLLVLTEKPVLRQGPNLLEAPVIRYNQAEGTYKAEGGTRMRFIQTGQDDPVSKAYRKRTGKKTP